MKLIVGIEALQILKPNSKRVGFEILYVPSSIEAGNTGKIYHATGKPPSSLTDIGNYDGVMISGVLAVRNFANGDSKKVIQAEQWLISDTAAQVVTVLEFLEPEL